MSAKDEMMPDCVHWEPYFDCMMEYRIHGLVEGTDGIFAVLDSMHLQILYLKHSGHRLVLSRSIN